jgi:1,2-diacylglycerol 3-alpha-glucosyltransferase
LDDYRQLVTQWGLQDRVTITGSVPYQQVPDYLALSDFFVTASVTEVHPFTLIEAAAAGLPTLGIRSPGISDIIQDGQTGLLAEDNDLSFGLRFLKLITDASLRCQLGQAARIYSQQLSAHANARRILQLYRAVTEGG